MNVAVLRARRAWSHPAAPLLATGLVVALVVGAWLRFGLSLTGIALLGPLVVAGGLALLLFRPGVPALLLPALIPLPAIWILFPSEFAFAWLLLLVVIAGIHARASWLTRLSRQEALHALLCLWGTFSVLWIFDFTWYVHGFRRLWIGFAAYWLARRMVHVVPRATFEMGLVLGALALSIATLGRRFGQGMTEQQAMMHRDVATNLGWGTANYIATLLLLLSPILIEIGRRGSPLRRVAAWSAVVLVGALQSIIASRAAGVLWAVATALQLAARNARIRVMHVMVALGALVAFLWSPLGQNIVARFTSLQELGSFGVRLWYFRVAWQRVVDNFPWGMGLNQGWSYHDRLYNTDPHNYWLAMAFELGIIGVVLWFLVLRSLWKTLVTMAHDGEWRPWGRALQIAFWLGQLHTLVEPTFQGPQYQLLFFWLMGGWIGYYEAARAETASPSNSR